MRSKLILFAALVIAGCCTYPKGKAPDYSSLKVGMTLSEAESDIGIAPWYWRGHIYSKPVYCFDSDGASAIIAIDHSMPEGKILWVHVDQHGKTVSEIRRQRQEAVSNRVPVTD